MVTQVPSRVFPLPGWRGPISDHHGVAGAIGGSDLMVPSAGTQPVVSMVSGKVEFVSSQATAPTSGGNAVQIKGIDGLSYYYAHLANALKLKPGDTVSAGQLLGYAGNSGNAANTPPHLHIGIGKSIQTGLGPQGGIGTGVNAVDMLRALVKQPSANNANIASPDVQKDLPNGGVIDVPDLHFVPSVPGFTSANMNGIMLNIKKALEAGIDPFIWLGIVSYESSFNPNAKNPTSGACGYAQIYPCIDLPPDKNIEEGLKRLKDFLHSCGGDMNCALNKYSGGGGQSYISTVMTNAKAIMGANPTLPTGDTFNPSAAIDDLGNTIGPIDSHGECPPIILHLGPADVPFPDVGCVIQLSINQLQDQMANWWRDWQTQNLPNLVFILWGAVFIIIGILLIAGTQTNIISLAKKAATKGAA